MSVFALSGVTRGPTEPCWQGPPAAASDMWRSRKKLLRRKREESITGGGTEGEWSGLAMAGGREGIGTGDSYNIIKTVAKADIKSGYFYTAVAEESNSKQSGLIIILIINSQALIWNKLLK